MQGFERANSRQTGTVSSYTFYAALMQLTKGMSYLRMVIFSLHNSYRCQYEAQQIKP